MMRINQLSRALLGLGLLAGLPAAALAQDAQSRLTGLQLSGDQPIQIESERLEVREGESVAVFSGNVSVVQGATLLKAGTMTVYYLKDGGSAATGSANIDRLEVAGNVYLKSEKQVATGDRGTFNMKTEVLELSGKEVVLSEGENVIVGCKLTVQMKSGLAKLDGCKGGGSGGRVKMLLTPGSQNNR
ncbi:LptA/OstA family protein [Nitratireductor pacificus]|uniref:OstA family protein n=1 Tax=Nitratireductor pacificus pht-3B TaxID=391937 RepID=K2N7H2_9HYPH|nr:OstA family protein [Nitratireductor pacificus pht-3B]